MLLRMRVQPLDGHLLHEWPCLGRPSSPALLAWLPASACHIQLQRMPPCQPAGLLVLNSGLRLWSRQSLTGARLLRAAVAAVSELQYVMVLPQVACVLLVTLGVFAFCIGERVTPPWSPMPCMGLARS